MCNFSLLHIICDGWERSETVQSTREKLIFMLSYFFLNVLNAPLSPYYDAHKERGIKNARNIFRESFFFVHQTNDCGNIFIANFSIYFAMKDKLLRLERTSSCWLKVMQIISHAVLDLLNLRLRVIVNEGSISMIIDWLSNFNFQARMVRECRHRRLKFPKHFTSKW